MIHDEIQVLLHLTRDRELPNTERAKVVEHLATCTTCQTDLHQLNVLSERLLHRSPPPYSEAFVERVMTRLEAQQPFWNKRWKRIWWIPVLSLSLASGFVIASWPDPTTIVSSDSVLVADGPHRLMDPKVMEPYPDHPELSDLLRENV